MWLSANPIWPLASIGGVLELAAPRAGLSGEIVGAQNFRIGERRRVRARTAEQIERPTVAENVARIAEEVLRIEQGRDVPPQTIADVEQEHDQPLRGLGTVVLDVDRRPEAFDGCTRAGDDIVLHAFDVDLEKPQPRQGKAVDGYQLHLLAAWAAERDAAQIGRAPRDRAGARALDA